MTDLTPSDEKDARCVHCRRLIRRPEPGSYPPAVAWVHVLSPLGAGNRYCGTGGTTARPTPPAEGDQ